MKNLYIQPSIHTYENYLEIARNNNLSFELVDFTSPRVLNSSLEYRERLQFYKSNKDQLPKDFTIHGPFFGLQLACPDKLIRKASIERARLGLEAALYLGAKSIVFHSGINPIIKNPVYLKNWLELHSEFYLNMIQEYGVEISIENVWDDKPDYLVELMKNINHKNINICLDIAHINAYTNTELTEWFSKLKSKINYIHLSDNLADYDAHLPLGKGNIDFNKVNELICTIDKPIIKTIEVSSAEDVKSSLNYLKKIH